MKTDDAVKIIERIMDDDWMRLSGDAVAALWLAIHVLENQKRYSWHDLRKDPEDLPKEQENILVCTDDGELPSGFPMTASAFWTRVRAKDCGIRAWKEIEPFHKKKE